MAKKTYKLIEDKNNKAKKLNSKITIKDGYGLVSRKKNFMIEKTKVKNIKVMDKKLIHNLVKKKVDTKYEKLIKELITLLIVEDETGDSAEIILDQIEKFRQEIKIKYKMYLTKKELDDMAKQLIHIKKQAKLKLIIIMNNQAMINSPQNVSLNTGKSR